jgi:glycosyltransferase involved in cell wall biosynthesis
MERRRTIAAVGDVADVASWSGIPYHFWRAATKAAFASDPWRVQLSDISWERYVWNGWQLLHGERGGFQYSNWFLTLLEKQVPRGFYTTEVITFNQHFPRASAITAAGGSLCHFIDAPFAALASGRGLDLRLPKNVVARAIELERANYAASSRVLTMARWASEIVIDECEVSPSKVNVVLPGANLELPTDWEFPVKVGRAGRDRDFVLGFIGADWKRKGLPLLVSVRDHLVERGWRVSVFAAGNAPADLASRKGVKFAGYIDKRTNPEAFLRFLTSTDLGCLFSEHEALGISTLEFLRAGVPVAGYAHEGMADTLPPDAGFRFKQGDSAVLVAEQLEAYLKDEPMQNRFQNNARQWSSLVTWERCVRELQELWETGKISQPVRPWMGLHAQKL